MKLAPVATMLAKLWCSLSEQTKPPMMQLLSANGNYGFVDQKLVDSEYVAWNYIMMVKKNKLKNRRRMLKQAMHFPDIHLNLLAMLIVLCEELLTTGLYFLIWFNSGVTQ